MLEETDDSFVILLKDVIKENVTQVIVVDYLRVNKGIIFLLEAHQHSIHVSSVSEFNDVAQLLKVRSVEIFNMVNFLQTSL